MSTQTIQERLGHLRESFFQVYPQANWKEQELLSEHTTFKIGGPADVFVEPKSVDELAFLLKEIHNLALPVFILGCGSNLLVKDGGIRGVVISLLGLSTLHELHDTTLIMGAGFTLKEVSETAYAHGLTGLEFAIGIPGTLGGAVFMNAGAYEGEMSFVVKRVRTVTKMGDLKVYETPNLGFSYRHSIFQDNGDVIVAVEMGLSKGEKKAIKTHMDELTEKRESKQPLEFPSAGSTFKRPPGYYAGTLIDQTGLKGFSVGDAEVSMKHAGFVINKGNAKADDVLSLIKKVQEKIKQVHGVTLETEVRIVGEDL